MQPWASLDSRWGLESRLSFLHIILRTISEPAQPRRHIKGMTFYRSILGSRSKRGDYCWLTNDPGPSVTLPVTLDWLQYCLQYTGCNTGLAAVHTLGATEQTGRQSKRPFLPPFHCRPMPVQNNLCSHEPMGVYALHTMQPY